MHVGETRLSARHQKPDQSCSTHDFAKYMWIYAHCKKYCNFLREHLHEYIFIGQKYIHTHQKSKSICALRLAEVAKLPGQNTLRCTRMYCTYFDIKVERIY